MSGIIFYKSQNLPRLKDFYTATIGCDIWLEQADCVIFRHGNLLVGFCHRDEIETTGLITFFYDTRDKIDKMYAKLKATAEGQPADNEKYNIYQFFARDPENRRLEFQYFNHPLAGYRSVEELMISRRSIRKFTDDPMTDELFGEIVELCRWAPTSYNSQSYYFKIVRDKETLKNLSETRGSSTEPIKDAPAAVVIVSDPSLTRRPEHDGCIAAYHFILAAWYFGLGTCWMAVMDREDVKEMLDIPQEHYVATVTPLGYPAKWPVRIPPRKNADWYLRER